MIPFNYWNYMCTCVQAPCCHTQTMTDGNTLCSLIKSFILQHIALTRSLMHGVNYWLKINEICNNKELISNQGSSNISPLNWECPHHWKKPYNPQILKCHLNPIHSGRKMSGYLHRGIGMCKVHAGIDDCVCIRIYWESAHLSNGCHLMVQFGNPLPFLLLQPVVGVYE